MRSPPQPSAEAPRELAAPAVIEMQEVSKAYGPFAALQGLSLSVPAGSVFALLGASGTGKTTAIKILLNILSASSGTVRILGVESSAIGPAELAQIGYVSENQSLPARLEVRQFFEYVRAAYATWDRDLEESLREQLHGMRLKMALACALPFRPKLLVLDEPLSGLDALARDEIIGGFLQQAGRMSILISSHELDEVERFATHVAFLHEGRLLFQGTVAALGEHALPLLRSAGDKGLERVSLRRIFVAMVGAAAMARRQSPAGRGG
jgi:ABC-2 type transport system ATP-binding protein